LTLKRFRPPGAGLTRFRVGLFFCVTAMLTLCAVPAHAASPRTYSLSTLHWRSIGPAVAGGRASAVAGSDRDPYLYYFGAAGGGVYRTTNGGVTWDDVFTKQPVAAVGAIAVAPSNKDVVWVGTGESKPRNDATTGDGIWQSTNGAKTWIHRGLDHSAMISRILIDPRDPNTVLAAVLGDPYNDNEARGVYRTSDGGVSWRKTLYAGPASGASDLAWDARDAKLVFAGIWQLRRRPWTFTSGGPADGLYRSRDGGLSWQHLSGHGLPGGLMGRIGVAVAPSDSRRVYALIQSTEGVLWRSDDSGDHWRLMSRDTLINQRPFYMSRLEVDPRNPDHVFFLSEDLLETKDGGKTFSSLTSETHQDHHAMWIASDGRRMIEANDGGAFISLDAGKIWDVRYNVSIAQIYHVGYDLQNPYHVCGGMQDNDAYCGPSDSLNPLGILTRDWRDVGNDGDGSWVVPDLLDPNLVWNVGVRDLNGQLGIFNLTARQNFDISPYVRDTGGIALAGLPYRLNWEAPIALSPKDPHIAYFGANVVFETRDRGRHWRQISPDLTRNDAAHQQVAGGPINTDVSGAEFYDTILDIAPSPLDANVLWAGTDDGLVQVTRDGGAHWKNVTMTGVAPLGRIDALEPSPNSAGSLFAVVDRHLMGDAKPYLFATDDFGATWRSLSGDLPLDQFAHVVRQDPRNPNILYAGLERGIWVSFNGGAHWQNLNLNMPAVSVHDVRVQPQADDLVIATHGRGFWILDDASVLQNLVPVALKPGVTLLAPRTAYNFFRWWSTEYGSSAGECCAPQSYFAGENPPAGALLTYYLPRRARQAPKLTFEDDRGVEIAHMTADNHQGINRVAWNLGEDAPPSWKSARDWNKGPDVGPAVIPGTYRVILSVDGTRVTQALTVKPDPRAPWTQADYVEHRDFLRELYEQFGQIDDALNRLDELNVKLRARLASLRGRDVSGHDSRAVQATLASAQSVAAQLSSHPVNSEDSLLQADGLRERLYTLIDSFDHLSQGPPLAAHRREAAEIKPFFDAAMARYHAFITHL